MDNVKVTDQVAEANAVKQYGDVIMSYFLGWLPNIAQQFQTLLRETP